VIKGAWARCLAQRAIVVGAVAAATTLVVVAATDAGGPWDQRLGMSAALAPICGALGTLAAVEVAAARGELLALAAVGVAPARAVAGAMLGGVAVGLSGPALVLAGLADLGALFPREAAARHWTPDRDGIVEATLGLRVGADGGLTLLPAAAAPTGLPPAAATFALLAIALAALVVPAWATAARASARRSAVLGGLAAATAIVAFQGVGAGRLPAWVLVAAPVVLAIEAIARSRRVR
jgi:hypothetical protein